MPPWMRRNIASSMDVERNQLKKFRESLLLTKSELARKARISRLTIDRIEAGKPCRVDTKRKLLFALGLKLSEKRKLFPD